MTEESNLTDAKVLTFLKELLVKIDDRKVNIEEFKALDAKILKLNKETAFNRRNTGKVTD